MDPFVKDEVSLVKILPTTGYSCNYSKRTMLQCQLCMRRTEHTNHRLLFLWDISTYIHVSNSQNFNLPSTINKLCSHFLNERLTRLPFPSWPWSRFQHQRRSSVASSVETRIIEPLDAEYWKLKILKLLWVNTELLWMLLMSYTLLHISHQPISTKASYIHFLNFNCLFKPFKLDFLESMKNALSTFYLRPDVMIFV